MTLPALYAGWLEGLLGAGAIPGEPEATCHACPLLQPARGLAPFNPDTKCCTYLPVIPNFLVGRALALTDGEDDPVSEAGRATVRARIAAGVAVTPLGLGRSRAYGLLYDHGDDVFGHARTLRCPHYLHEHGGKCGVWRSRNATCATWFCKHARGALGHRFWTAVHQLLDAIEQALCRHCVLELDLDLESLAWLFPSPRLKNHDKDARASAEEIDQVRDDARQAGMWGEWLGREEGFYRDCAALVDTLSWKDVLRIGGPEVQIAVKLLRAAHRDHDTFDVPAKLRVGALQILAADEETACVRSYSPFDLLDLPHEILDALRFFDGRPTEEALAAIARDKGLDLEPALVRKLCDFKVLT